MRYLFILMLTFLCCDNIIAQETKITSWNDFIALTSRTFRTGSNRIVLSEEMRVTDTYTHRSFDAEESVSGYYIIILYYSRFCTSPPTEYFNYGENSGGNYTFHGNNQEYYCYHLLKVKTFPGKKGHVYIKNTGNICEGQNVKLFVIEY